MEVYAASLNPCDYKFRRNYIPTFVRPLPKIPGGDIAGIVTEVGSEVRNIDVGDRVAAMIPLLGSKWGGCAEYVAVDWKYVAIIPPILTFSQAASLPLVALTAMTAFDSIPLPHTNKSILIHAGSGGVGSFAIQYAKKVLGMGVVTTTCSKRNEEFVRSIGADNIIDYTETDFTTVVHNYDVILDPMSFLYEASSMKQGVISQTGQYFNILSSDFSLKADGTENGNGWRTFLGPFISRVGRRLGFKMVDYQTIAVAPSGEVLKRVFDTVESGLVRPIVNVTFQLSNAADAMKYLERGKTTGKVILLIRDEE